MYKAFSSGLLGFRDRSLQDDIPPAKKYGYAGLNFDMAREGGGDAGRAKALLEEAGLVSGGFGLPVDYRTTAEAFEEDMAKLPAYCQFAQKTGSDRCITWIIPWSDTLDYKANFELHKTRLTRVAKTLAEYGIRFGIEFVGPPRERAGKKYGFIHDLDGLMELLTAIGTDNLGILMDVWHWDMAGQTFEDFKKIPSQEWVVMAHINDAPAGVPVEQQQDLVRELPGATGVLRIEEFMRGLTGMGYDGPVYVEPFNEPLKALPFEEAVKTAKAAMDKVWPK